MNPLLAILIILGILFFVLFWVAMKSKSNIWDAAFTTVFGLIIIVLVLMILQFAYKLLVN